MCSSDLVEVMVDRVGKELPIAKVPNLQTGDRLWVHPNFHLEPVVPMCVKSTLGKTQPKLSNLTGQQSIGGSGVR